MDPKISESTLDKLRPGWRGRRSKRKSIWNPLCALIGFVIALIAWYYLFQGAWRLHTALYPAHTSLKKEFWGAGISDRAFSSSFLMLIPLGVPATVLGFLTANLGVWCIPSARAVMEREAAGDQEMSFAGSNAGLLKWGGLASGICILLSLVGVATLSSLK